MSKSDWDTMSDANFETLLQTSISDVPPEHVVTEVNPWRKAIKNVLIGMAFCTVTLNFEGLNYILPVIGIILTMIGFRTLHADNVWFKLCFIISVVRGVCFFPIFILNTTIINEITEGRLVSLAGIFNTLMILCLTFCLWQGIRTVQRKAGILAGASGAVWLLVWYAILCALAVIQYTGMVIVAVMVIGYCVILRSLYSLSREFDEAGYSVKTTSVKVSNRGIALILCLILLIGVVAGYVLGGSYPMRWQPIEGTEVNELIGIKSRLRALGFPESVLNDLTAEEIKNCDGALRVVVESADEPVNDGRIENVQEGEGDEHYFVEKIVYDVRELRITDVAVQIKDKPEQWVIFHHFLWIKDPGFYGTESINLWPSYGEVAKGWTSDGEIGGRVLYDDYEGNHFAAPYYFVGNRTYTSDGLLSKTEEKSEIFADFSMPRKGEKFRGYITYKISALEEGYMISSWINYTHQKSCLQYPVETASQYRMKGIMAENSAFITVQHALKF